jgi:hypothetical protein
LGEQLLVGKQRRSHLGGGLVLSAQRRAQEARDDIVRVVVDDHGTLEEVGPELLQKSQRLALAHDVERIRLSRDLVDDPSAFREAIAPALALEQEIASLQLHGAAHDPAVECLLRKENAILTHAAIILARSSWQLPLPTLMARDVDRKDRDAPCRSALDAWGLQSSDRPARPPLHPDRRRCSGLKYS